MARLRKGVAYRSLERPYTRKSKFKAHNFVRGAPTSKVIRYNMGNTNGEFPITLQLITKESLQIRHNAIESARQSSNRLLEKSVGKENYFYQLRIYPHHILRENPLASGAGADRMSTGMQKAFGKTIGIAAQVKKGQVLAILRTTSNHVKTARLALKRAGYKMPCKTSIEVIGKVELTE